MKKGTAVVQLVAAVIILLFTVWTIWSFVYGSEIPKPSVSSNETKIAIERDCEGLDGNCQKNPYGSRCISVSDPNNPGPLTYSCGCLVIDDCKSTADVKRGDTCSDNNRCT